MKRAGAWIVLVAALLSSSITSCSRHKLSPEMAALDEAYHAGLLTRAEYDAKKAALDARTAAPTSQNATLAALDRAVQAGVLTRDEYDAKKAAVLAAPTPAPALASPEASPSAPAAAPPPPSDITAKTPAGAYRMKLVKVIDQYGFERPMPSESLLIPVDWQMQGATTWNIKDGCNTIQTHLVASGPDGRTFEQFAPYSWTWADDPRPLQQIFAQKANMGTHACDVMAPMSAQDYIRRSLTRLRPNAQLVGFEPAQTLMDNLAQQARQTEQSARQYNLTQRVKFDAIKARVKYTLEGRPVEEWLVAAVVVTGTLGPSLNIQTMQQTKTWNYNCVAYSAAQRAPEGQLDASGNLFELIASTFRQNPEWQARVSGHALSLQRIEQKGIADRSAIVAKSAEDSRNTQRQIYENQTRGEEHTSAQFGQYVRGVESYRDPSSGETVDLDNRYGHAWANNRGEYLLSDQAGFDPNTVAGNTQSWTQMQVVKK